MRRGRSALQGLLFLALLALLANRTALQAALRIFLGEEGTVYPLKAPWVLILEHLGLAAGSSLFSGLVGVVSGIFITRPEGRPFKDLLLKLGAFAQTFPPVAVLALLVPVIGFGNSPVLLALVLYGLLPVIHGTATGIDSVRPEIKDAARGLGMGELQRLVGVEIPLALPAIMAGFRTSIIINIGTTAIGAAFGTGGLGRPIMAGIIQFKTSYLLQGAVTAAVLALSINWVFEMVERGMRRRVG